MTLLSRVVVPVATEDDARSTCAALEPHLDEIEQVIAVHVIEKAGGGIDKAPLEKRREDAAEMLATVDSLLGGRVSVDTRVAFGTDVVSTLFEEADDTNATAVAFAPRSGGRLTRFLSGDTATRIVTEAELPVVALPRVEGT